MGLKFIMSGPPSDILTVHLNDYFQCNASSAVVPRRYWGRFQLRIEDNTLQLLRVLERHNCQATFFSSGWIADRVPGLLAEIAERGHEIASTGYYQYPVSKLSMDELRSEAVRSRVALERACGREVIGYRCAGWLKPDDLWALEVLAQEGFQYDSSFYYLGLTMRGERLKKPKEFKFRNNRIWEVPIPYGTVGGIRFPISGGTYLRQLPQAFMQRQIERWRKQAPGPWLIYFQVAELDQDQPRISALSWLREVQKYRNIPQMRDRVLHHLERSDFSSISRHLDLKVRPTDAAHPALPQTAESTDSGLARDRRPITIVVPCYQEEDAIPYLGNALQIFETNHARDFDVSYVFVDDGSRDRTHERLSEIFGSNRSAIILRHSTNQGVAAAMLTGIRNAPTETVCVIDCDCSYDPETLAAMVPKLRDNVALVTASPYHKEGAVVNVPGWRLLLSRGLSLIYQQLLSTRLATYTSCCRVYRQSTVVDLDLEHGDFLGVTEIIVRLDERGEKMVEVPAVLEARIFGVSKMKTVRTIIAHTRSLISLVARRLSGRLSVSRATNT